MPWHIDKKNAGLLIVFDRLRRKRNMALYDDTGFVSRHDAEQALESADDYLNVIRADIAPKSLESETHQEISALFFRPLLSMGKDRGSGDSVPNENSV